MDFVISLIFYAFVVYCLSTICRKAGFHPLLGILAFLPIVNIVLLYYVAFAPWPRFETLD